MTETNDTPPWFPEPATEDDWFSRKGEDTFAWVSRATSENGKACKRFLNENIAKVPIAWRSKLYHDLRKRDWDTVFFELVVARTMQSITYVRPPGRLWRIALPLLSLRKPLHTQFARLTPAFSATVLNFRHLLCDPRRHQT